MVLLGNPQSTHSNDKSSKDNQASLVWDCQLEGEPDQQWAIGGIELSHTSSKAKSERI